MAPRRANKIEQRESSAIRKKATGNSQIGLLTARKLANKEDVIKSAPASEREILKRKSAPAAGRKNLKKTGKATKNRRQKIGKDLDGMNENGDYEKVFGAVVVNGDIRMAVKLKNCDELEFQSFETLKKSYPQLLFDFFQRHFFCC